MVRLRALILLLALFLVLSGCATVNTLPTFIEDISRETTELQLVAPERKMVKTADVPDDAKLAVAALVMEMRRKPGAVDRVTFDPSGSHRIADPELDYSGFEWFHWDIDAYRVISSSSRKAVVRTTGGLYFADALGRAASGAYRLDYEIRPGKIVITQSTFALLRPPFPKVEAYFVPLDAVQKEAGNLKSFAAFYRFAKASALPMIASAEEIAAREQAEQATLWEKVKADVTATGIEGDWAALVFCMDRLASDAEFKILVTETESILVESLAEAVYFDEAGWRIAMVAGHGRLHSERDRFFVQALYQPSPGYWEKPVLAGRFESAKAYPSAAVRPEPAAPAERKQMQKQAQAKEGPLALGKRLLNPAVREDARLIQGRLAELGYYDLKVDGLFGRGSKAALQRFRKGAMGDGALKWDLETQQALFAGSGQ